MESPVPDLHYYMRIAKNKGIDEEAVRAELIDLIDETKSYIGAMQIMMKKLNGENNERNKIQSAQLE